MLIVRVRVRLKPNHPECADQSEQRAKLELPLPNNDALLWKKCQRQKRCENDRSPGKNRVNTGPNVEKRHHLRDLMNYVWQAWQQTKFHRVHVNTWPAAANLIKQ